MTNDETAEVVARTTIPAVHVDTLARESCLFELPASLPAQAMLCTVQP
jgi:hypothetical protein